MERLGPSAGTLSDVNQLQSESTLLVGSICDGFLAAGQTIQTIVHTTFSD